MKSLLKNAREAKGMKARELAQLAKIDQALISKFESGARKPTKDQIKRLAELLDIDLEELTLLWLKEKILYEIGNEPLALKALKLVEADLSPPNPEPPKPDLQNLMADFNALKEKLDQALKG